MNIIQKLTLRHLKLNKRRTFVTIIGVIIAAAMITAVATSVNSFMDLMQRRVIEETGKWHQRYSNVSVKDVDGVAQDKNIKSLIVSKDIGYAALEGSINPNKPYLFVQGYDKEGMKDMFIHLIKGQLPQAENEIVLSEHIENNGGVYYQVGDTLTLSIGKRYMEREGSRCVLDQNDCYITTPNLLEGQIQEEFIPEETREYKVVGVMERPEWEGFSSPGYTMVTYLDKDKLDPDDIVTVSVFYKKINKKIYEEGSQLFSSSDRESDINQKPTLYNGSEFTSAEMNRRLLDQYGVTRDSGINGVILVMEIILFLIIITGSVSLIYNAFSISMSERSRYLGMMASVGATKKQKKSSVYFEGFVIGLIGIPIGIIAGNVGMAVTFHIVNPMIMNLLDMRLGIRLIVSYQAVAVAIIVSSFTIFISSYIPARRATKITPMDAIRQSKDIKLSKKSIKTSYLSKALFGFEGELALKNMKRNKKRYRSIVFSLFISFVLFLSVASYSYYLKNAFLMTDDSTNYDEAVYYGTKEINEEVKKIAAVKEYAEVYSASISAYIDWEQASSIMTNRYQEILRTNSSFDEESLINLRLSALDRESLRKYAKKTGVPLEELYDTQHPKVIVINPCRIRTNGQIELFNTLLDKTKKIMPGMEYVDKEEGDSFQKVTELEIATLADDLPMGFEYNTNIESSIQLIMSKPVLEKVYEQYLTVSDSLEDEIQKENNLDQEEETESGELGTKLYLIGKNPKVLHKELDKLKVKYGEKIYLSHYYEDNLSEKQMVLLVSIFAYGFIVLMSTICAANIFNGISTGIILRKRELATLRSVGMTPKAFRRMIAYESIFYGLKALLWGIPVSFAIMYLIYKTLQTSFIIPFTVPWGSVIFGIFIVFMIVGLSMWYSASKIKRENIVDALKNENI